MPAPAAAPMASPTGPVRAPSAIAPKTPAPKALLHLARARASRESGALVRPFQARAVLDDTIPFVELQDMQAGSKFRRSFTPPRAKATEWSTDQAPLAPWLP